jgi:hypothetical protein
MPGCNEWNEALDAARSAITAARRLALVDQNALINGDVRRAWSALREFHDATAGAGHRRAGLQKRS